MAVTKTNPNQGTGDRVYSSLLLLSGFFCYFFIHGISWTVGVFYAIFLENLEFTSRPQVALGTALNSALVYGAAPLASLLINYFGTRCAGLLGGLMAGAGLICTIFSRNVFLMCAMFGVACGTGFGFSHVACVMTITHHFDKYRPLALAITSSALGAGMFMYPPLIRLLIQTYGWRGTLAILGAITFNLLVCAAIYRTKSSGKSQKRQVDMQAVSCAPGGETADLKNKFCDVFTNKHFVVFCISNILACMGMSVIYVHLASYAQSMDISADKSALLFSTIGGANVLGRLVYGVLNQIRGFTGLVLYTSSFIMAGLATVLLPLASTYFHLHVYAAVFGLVTASFGIATVDALVRMWGISMITTVYGCLLPFEAVGQALGGPVAGLIFELTGMYSSSMYFGSCILILSSTMMIPTTILSFQPKTITYEDSEMHEITPRTTSQELHVS